MVNIKLLDTSTFQAWSIDIFLSYKYENNIMISHWRNNNVQRILGWIFFLIIHRADRIGNSVQLFIAAMINVIWIVFCSTGYTKKNILKIKFLLYHGILIWLLSTKNWFWPSKPCKYFFDIQLLLRVHVK